MDDFTKWVSNREVPRDARELLRELRAAYEAGYKSALEREPAKLIVTTEKMDELKQQFGLT